jgi:hypothetical protein
MNTDFQISRIMLEIFFMCYIFATCSQLIYHGLMILIIFVEQRKFKVSFYAVFPIFLTVMSDLAWLRLYFVKDHKLEASSCAELSIWLKVLFRLVAFRIFPATKAIRLFATDITDWCSENLLLTEPTGVQRIWYWQYRLLFREFATDSTDWC